MYTLLHFVFRILHFAVFQPLPKPGSTPCTPFYILPTFASRLRRAKHSAFCLLHFAFRILHFAVFQPCQSQAARRVCPFTFYPPSPPGFGGRSIPHSTFCGFQPCISQAARRARPFSFCIPHSTFCGLQRQEPEGSTETCQVRLGDQRTHNNQCPMLYGRWETWQKQMEAGGDLARLPGIRWETWQEPVYGRGNLPRLPGKLPPSTLYRTPASISIYARKSSIC